MLEAEVILINSLGLHARAAAKVVKAAERFQSEITVSNATGQLSADAKSIFKVLLLAAAKGDRLIVAVDGPDEEEAIGEIQSLFESGFYEE